MSKFRPSTLRCAFSIELLTIRASIASPFSKPRFCMKPRIRSDVKMRMRLSSIDR